LDDPTVNPLLEGLEPERVAPPAVLVVFGASGDLTARKLLPALTRLALRGSLPGAFGVVGVARTEMDDAGFAERALAAGGEAVSPAWADLAGGFRYVCGEYEDPETFKRLEEVLEEIDAARGTAGNRLYYLATPPSTFVPIVRALGEAGLNRPRVEGGFVRIVVEKPYGRDLDSALTLDAAIHEVFDESQIYRIDHYLGKETVQNLLAFRFANTIFEPVWNRRYVDHIQITAAESEGVGHRGPFYEEAGALRDIVQNHVMQVLSLVLMEPPVSMDADGIRDEKVKALKAVEIPTPEEAMTEVVRARYIEGWVGGEAVPGYRQEEGVDPRSQIETFVALRLRVDDWRWAGVPIYIRAGKRLPKRVTEVALQFKPVPHLPFRPWQVRGLEPNTLLLRIQPDEGITLRFGAKVPGPHFEVRSVSMEMLYGSAFPELMAADAYERLLLDALIGDQTLFIRRDEVMQAWRIVAPLLEAWENEAVVLARYPAGTWGPKEADLLIARDGRRWRNP
jgi:glucose-6-phosphate 1-dehydrogenase